MVTESEHSPICEHFQRAAELIARRWSPLIISALLAGNARFTDIRDSVPGLSDRLLSGRLKELEAAGIVTRTVTPTTPVRIEYGLTEQGRDLSGLLDEMRAWAERWALVETGARVGREPGPGSSARRS